ncbi:MAG: zf-HC2 domain-containing protein [Candidatus Aminicenantes bacterium]|nr:MAG: zf-HC2 domain-containing protein [Candidatus Aminicenantes bacterium]
MNCKKAEKFLLKSLDGLLRNEETQKFEKHLERCLRCQAKKEQYQAIRRALKEKDYLEPKPYFWERLKSKLKEEKKYEPWSQWKRWSLRAIPLSLLIVIILAATIILLIPTEKEELSESGVLLLRNLNPFPETRTLLEAESIENRNMMLIFTATQERNGERRYFP